MPCFALNALTFVAMIFALWGMDPRGLHTAPVAAREPGAIRAGLRYVRRTPELAVPLALMALVGTLGFNFQVVLPLLAKFSFDGGAIDLRGAGLGDGGRLDRRRPRQRRPRPHRPAPDRRRRARLRARRAALRRRCRASPSRSPSWPCSAPPR